MQGNLSQISLTDLLLLTTTGKKSGVLKLAHEKETVEVYLANGNIVGSSRVDLQACKLEYSIVSPK